MTNKLVIKVYLDQNRDIEVSEAAELHNALLKCGPGLLKITFERTDGRPLHLCHTCQYADAPYNVPPCSQCICTTGYWGDDDLWTSAGGERR